jgi:hypothetical protein
MSAVFPKAEKHSISSQQLNRLFEPTPVWPAMATAAAIAGRFVDVRSLK